MSQLKVNALVSYSGNTVTLGTSGDTINVASGVTFNTASATVNLPTTIKVSTIQNTNSTNLITQTNVTTITFGATSQTISVPSVASFASTIGVGGATPAASGAGITFPASASASSDANTLDDYEEGTWTPTDGSGASLSLTITNATYTKIGREVTCYLNLQYPSTANANNSQINGLPFVPANTAGGSDMGFGGFVTITNYDANYTVYIEAGNTILRIYTRSIGRITNATISGKIFEFVLKYYV
jgi:hypothetical protein